MAPSTSQRSRGGSIIRAAPSGARGGCHVKVIAEQMGHSDGGSLILRRYGHLYKGARRQAAIALESHVFEASKNPSVRRTYGELQL
jgi:hypothetical protein